MDGIVPESLISNINQRNEETSDESEDYCFENGNIDDETTIITMYKSHDGSLWSKISSLFVRRVMQQDLFTIMLILQQMFLKDFWV